MVTRGARKASSDEAPVTPQVPQTHPQMGYGMHGHDFTLQAVMDLQRAVGALDVKLDQVKGAVDSTKGKVDELIKWKHMIIGGAVVLTTLLGAAITVIVKFSDYISIKTPAVAVAQPPAPTAPPPGGAPAAAAQAATQVGQQPLLAPAAAASKTSP